MQQSQNQHNRNLDAEKRPNKVLNICRVIPFFLPATETFDANDLQAIGIERLAFKGRYENASVGGWI